LKCSLSLGAIIGVLIFSSPLISGERDELFEENQALKKSLKALEMECTVLTVQCKERADAIVSSDFFNKSFDAALQKNLDQWPNNEIEVAKQALEKRKAADHSFRQQFFGRASKEYKEASALVTDLLIKADEQLEQYIAIAEKYLYINEKPEWAVSYFNKAAPYAPGDERIVKGLARIRFLRNFESDTRIVDRMITAGQFTSALKILEDLLQGDPGNSEIIEKIKISKEGQRRNNIASYFKKFEEEYEKSLVTEGFDKLGLIDKINNALLTFGNNEETKNIKQLLDKILADVYKESFENLQNSFINQTIAIEDLYSEASKIADLYPDQPELQNLYEKVTKKRNEKLFNQLIQQAEVSIQNEDWTKSVEELSQVSELKSSEEVKSRLSVVTEIYANNKKIIDITENSVKKLGTQREIDDAKNLIKNTKNLSKDLDTPMLDESIGKLDKKIQSYESLLLASQKKKSPPSIKTPTPPPSISKQDTPPASPPTDDSYFINAKLDLGSFTKVAVCREAIKNKRIVVSFSIEVSSTGRALSVEVNNEDEYRLGSRETEVIKLVVSALKKSKYTPAVRSGISVVSVLNQKLTIPARFCT